MTRGPAQWGINTSVIVFVKAFWWLCFDIVAADIAAFYGLLLMHDENIYLRIFDHPEMFVKSYNFKFRACSQMQVPFLAFMPTRVDHYEWMYICI